MDSLSFLLEKDILIIREKDPLHKLFFEMLILFHYRNQRLISLSIYCRAMSLFDLFLSQNCLGLVIRFSFPLQESLIFT